MSNDLVLFQDVIFDVFLAPNGLYIFVQVYSQRVYVYRGSRMYMHVSPICSGNGSAGLGVCWRSLSAVAVEARARCGQTPARHSPKQPLFQLGPVRLRILGGSGFLNLCQYILNNAVEKIRRNTPEKTTDVLIFPSKVRAACTRLICSAASVVSALFRATTMGKRTRRKQATSR